jgi:hypothetical protein
MYPLSEISNDASTVIRKNYNCSWPQFKNNSYLEKELEIVTFIYL